ncbi:MAG: lactate dehydrogenase [Firmicutes bacterium]|nr:lactate dehydrogenase [Bacillota bacterium]
MTDKEKCKDKKYAGRRSIFELVPEASQLRLAEPIKHSGIRVNLLALGDVGATLLMALKVLGGGLIERIGIYDVNPDVMSRFEIEMNQIGWPFGEKKLPEVVCLDEEDLFDCDMFVFCASKAVPPIGAGGDVRMAQLAVNSKIVSYYGRLAGEKNYKGIFAVVSDPVDPLCKAALLASGLQPGQVRGYGLGVMNKRAEYYARGDRRFESYLTEGRAFGPHGGDLVIANSIENYDDEVSRELTALTVAANLKVRELGFKPYIAPALSSGAISLLLTLRGEWNYSSVYMGKGTEGAFLGIKNRIDPASGEVIIEDLLLPQKLYDRIENAYRNLCEIN